MKTAINTYHNTRLKVCIDDILRSNIIRANSGTLSKRPNKASSVLVLGGYGFIGRHVVEALKNVDTDVWIGTRRAQTALSPKNEKQVRLHTLATEPQWDVVLDGIDVLINTVGILRQRWDESYEQVHHIAVETMAKACAERGIRFIHVSALGLNHPAKSRFLTSKKRGEQALVKSRGDWHLVRPSIVDGEGGYGAKWFRRVAKWPIHFVPSNADGLVAPINANDLGKAIANIALNDNPTFVLQSKQRIYELGGTKKMTLRQYLMALSPKEMAANAKPARCVLVPAGLARLVSHVCDALHLTPFSFGHYELLKNDNLPEDNRLDQMLTQWQCRKRAKLLLNTARLTVA